MNTIKTILILLFFCISSYSQALKFDGDDYVTVDDETSMDWFDYNVPATFTFWLRYYIVDYEFGVLTKALANPWAGGFIIACGNGYGLGMYVGLRMHENGPQQDWNRYFASNLVGNGSGSWNWHHFAITYDGIKLINGVTVYCDGIPATQYSRDTSDVLDATTKSDTVPTIGRFGSDMVTSTCRGDLGKLKIYKKVLSREQVINDMNDMGAQTNDVNSQGYLMNYWKLDNVNYSKDYSGNGGDGHVVGCAISTTCPSTITMK